MNPSDNSFGYDKDDIFAAWLDRHLTEEEQANFEHFYSTDQAFSAAVDNAKNMRQVAQNFDSVPVPHWDKRRLFSSASYERIRTTPWFSIAAMAMSVGAMILVLSGTQLRIDSEGVTFFSATSQASLNALVDEKLTQFHSDNQVLLQNYADAMKEQQEQSAVALTHYLLSSSRQERQADFAELVSFINNQRQDDQRFMTRQLSSLQREINSIGQGYPSTMPANYLMSEEDE